MERNNILEDGHYRKHSPPPDPALTRAELEAWEAFGESGSMLPGLVRLIAFARAADEALQEIVELNDVKFSHHPKCTAVDLRAYGVEPCCGTGAVERAIKKARAARLRGSKEG